MQDEAQLDDYFRSTELLSAKLQASPLTWESTALHLIDVWKSSQAMLLRASESSWEAHGLFHTSNNNHVQVKFTIAVGRRLSLVKRHMPDMAS